MVHHISMEQTTVTMSEYNHPVIFSKLKDGTEFMLLLHNIVYVKVPPQNVTESGGSSRKINAISKSRVGVNLWILDADIAYIKEQ